MKPYYFLFTLIFFLFWSCTKDEYSLRDHQLVLESEIAFDLDHMAPALKAKKHPVERPYYDKVSGTIEFPGACPTGGPLVEINGEGQGTHVGKFTVRIESQCAFPRPVLGTIYAANGDQIHFELRDSTAPIINVLKFIGGTGRFEFAAGEIYQTGILDIPGGVWEFESRGTIIY